MNANEQFEYMAELFFKETLFMAPGKSCPPGMYTEDEQEEAQELWKKWVEEFYNSMFEDHKIKTDFIKNTK